MKSINTKFEDRPAERVIILGASGQAKVVADIVTSNGDIIVGFLDREDKYKSFIGYPILGKDEDYIKYLDCKFIAAIGNANIRERVVKELRYAEWYTAIHPTAVISPNNTFIGEGTVVMANAVVNTGTTIGKHCILNTCSVVEHDNIVEDYVHISVGTKLAGSVHIGKRTWVGIGATVIDGISVCDDCILGAGTVVVKNIDQSGTYVGMPSRKIK